MSQKIEHQKELTLRDSLLPFCTPTAELVADLERCAHLMCVSKGEHVVEQGEVCNVMVVPKSGVYRIGRVDNGVEDTVAFGEALDWYTSLHSWNSGKPAVFFLSAITDGEVWTISYNAISRIKAVHPSFCEFLINFMKAQLCGIEVTYTDISSMSAEERLRSFNQRSSAVVDRTDYKEIAKVVPLKYVAQYLGITVQHLSRIRRKLTNRS